MIVIEALSITQNTVAKPLQILWNGAVLKVHALVRSQLTLFQHLCISLLRWKSTFQCELNKRRGNGKFNTNQFESIY